MIRHLARRSRGISLIEAVVALAVMAFGMVAIIGLQASLRGNADQSRQRAEAVRIAQETVEQRRAFSVMAAASGVDAYADIATQPDATVSGLNADYTVTETVVDVPDPPQKTLTVDVVWQDRANETQRVRIATRIAAVAPELVGGLAAPGTGSPAQQIGRRHPSIPPNAIAQPDGTSVFTPPGAPGGVSWIFNDLSGVITRIGTSPGVCADTTALLVSGYVRFATGSAPLPANAEQPSGAAEALLVQVDLTAPSVATIGCFTQLSATVVTYYCAIPVGAPGTGWAGRTVLSGLTLSPALADATVTNRKVCRYTPASGCDPAVGSTIWGFPGAAASCSEPSPQTSPPTPGRLMVNADHPLDYVGVTAPLTNQDFLVISAGDGTTAFGCPGDDTSTPFVNGNTRRHQPLS